MNLIISRETMKKELIGFIKEDEMCNKDPLFALMMTASCMSFIDFLFKGVAEDENNGKMS